MGVNSLGREISNYRSRSYFCEDTGSRVILVLEYTAGEDGTPFRRSVLYYYNYKRAFQALFPIFLRGNS